MNQKSQKVIKGLRYFLLGVGFTIILLILGIGFWKLYELNSYSNKKLIESKIEAPYYDKKSFQLPKDVEQSKNTSSSATIIENIKLPIIMYHYVEYVKDVNDIIRKRLDISPDIFESHLKVLLENNYKTYLVRDMPGILNKTIVPSSKSIILTFDDGYEDFYTVVFPLLKKYQVKATIYIIYDYIGRKGFLNDKEIKELIASDLVEIGSHTLDHLYLKSVPLTTAKKQIIDSKKKLEEEFNIEIKTFAYPYGAFIQDTIDLVKEAGYTAAVSVIPGAYHSSNDLYYLSRIRPGMFTPNSMIKVLDGYNK